MTATNSSEKGASADKAAGIPDDKEMMRAAAELTRDISKARPDIYWPDMLISTAVGYGAIAGAILTSNIWVMLGCAVVAIIAVYRALLFIHEITHLHKKALPGFRTIWNLLVGIPLLTPSFMYEGVHTIHHSRKRYGTIADPEYLPLALMKPWTLPGFVIVALLAPFALIFRWGILAPLGVIIPPLRRINWAQFSSLSTNPSFRRKAPQDENKTRYILLETGASIWAITLLISTQFIGWRPLLVAMAILSLVAFFNQLRTLVAHLWENNGEEMTLTAQYLDSVNVPSPIAELWAPVGLRFHATHHLLPSLPYHSLAEAHRRMTKKLAPDTTYFKANYSGMMPLIAKIAKSSMGKRG